MGKYFLTSITENVLGELSGLIKGSPQETKIVFIPTAANPYENKSFMESDLEEWIKLGYDVVVLDIKGKKEEEISKTIADADIVYISGGNIFYLLKCSQLCGLKGLIEKFLINGGLYAGGSAGAAIIGPSVEVLKTIDDPSKGEDLSDFNGFGFLDFTVLPHYDHEIYHTKFQNIIKNYPEYKFEPLKNNEAMFIDGNSIKYIGR